MVKATIITSFFSLLLKIFSLGSFLVGIGFITFGCVLQSPPKAFVPGCVLEVTVTLEVIVRMLNAKARHRSHLDATVLICIAMIAALMNAFCNRALVAIGCFTILSSAIGYAGSRFRPIFLGLFLVVGTFATTLQLLIVLSIFAAQEKVADEIEKADSISGVKHFDK